jgi:hypothetical protein
MESASLTIVALPELSFPKLRALLTELGWGLDSATEKSILPGEPELAVFVNPATQARIHYTFNPVVKFRVLQFRGDEARSMHAQVAGRIPILGVNDLRALLDSSEIKQLLLGLFAAEELSEIALIEQVAKLSSHSDSKIARTAVRVRDFLFHRAAGWVARELATEQALHPERSAWFSHLSQPELRKQVLRWFMHDSTGSSQSIDQVLHSALQDSDAEVRVTAVLAATRLKATNLVRALRHADMPTSTSLGADERDRFFYEKLRQTAVRYLASSAPDGSEKAEEKRLQFERAVSGALAVRDDPTLLLYALTTPLQLGEPPSHLPDCMEHRNGAYYLRRSGLGMRWIAPVAHWVGEDSAKSPQPSNPIRQITPNAGFFIAESPVSSALALWTSEARQSPPPTVQPEPDSFLCGYEEALHLCELLGQLDGIQLELPTAEHWEMGARGPDGRRYPWGNSLIESGPLQPSPWLVKNMVGRALEWTSDLDPRGLQIVCGGGKTLACARRQALRADDGGSLCAVRPVLRGATK